MSVAIVASEVSKVSSRSGGRGGAKVVVIVGGMEEVMVTPVVGIAVCKCLLVSSYRTSLLAQ